MRMYYAVAAMSLVAFLHTPARPQNAAQIQELRRQVEALEKQMQQAGRGDPFSTRVTEIGGSRARPREIEQVVRIYDVSDLFQVAPPYVAEFQSDLANTQRPSLFDSSVTQGQAEPTGKGGGFGGGGFGGGGGFFDVPDPRRSLPGKHAETLHQFGGKLGPPSSNRITTDSLIEAITSTISPSTWSDSGGPGTIAKVGNSLVISTDVETHERIDALLDLFRKRWGTLRTISVRAYWIWLTDAELEPLLAKAKPDGAKPDGGKQADKTQAYGVVDAAAWQALLKDRQKPDNKRRPGYRAAVTCYNGQTVHTQAGGQSLAVTQIEPEVAPAVAAGGEGQIAYRPLVSIVQEGAVLQVTPSATYSGRYVVLDVHSRVTRLSEAGKRGAGGPVLMEKVEKLLPARAAFGPEQVVAALDRPLLLTQRLSTTLRLPADRPTLIGGMTVGQEQQSGEPTLYLFALVSVQELRDDLEAIRADEPDAEATEEAKPVRAPPADPANSEGK